jgi:hypothetical protein
MESLRCGLRLTCLLRLDEPALGAPEGLDRGQQGRWSQLRQVARNPARLRHPRAAHPVDSRACPGDRRRRPSRLPRGEPALER